jgi:tRNA(adenine34) deaminase
MKSKGKKERSKNRWVQTVTSVSTFPPRNIFTKDAAAIARSLGGKKVSPKGIGSGIRMIQYFINRGGKGLSAGRKRELEKAKKILQAKLHKQK